MLERPVRWYEKWLARDQEFSPQPYWQLATVLRGSGYPKKADDIFYAARVRERDQAWDRGEIGHWAFLTALQYTIGYGIGLRYFYVLGWMFALTLIGFFVLLHVNRKGYVTLKYKMRHGCSLFWASLSHVLPIPLDSAQEKIIINGNLPHLALSWFRVQKILGWVLGIFLIAALAGLTQR